MKHTLQWLTTTRDARREAAIVKLSHARQQCQAAEAALHHAQLALQQALQWRSSLLSQCTLGHGLALRDAQLPACDALIEQRHQLWAQHQLALFHAQQLLQTQQDHLNACERDALRLQEWRQLQHTQARRDQARLEDQQDDERPCLHAGARGLSR